jgi:UDPglucose 6-dehydrogenase
MKVCVLGLWHLGTVTAACLASAGHDVTGLDFDETVVATLRGGKPPLFEPGLEDLVRAGLSAGKLGFSSDVADAAGADVVWVTYDTPVDDEDRADVEFVVERVARLYPHLSDGVLVLTSSQLPVGTTHRLASAFAAASGDRNVEFGYSPENLRLGKAIAIFTQPDRVVVGVRTPAARHRVAELLRPFTDRIEWMSVESAEMTKHALNAFLATSVTFINEIAALAEQVGADATEVERGLKSEMRIGPHAYLSPGGAFAGGTLARDIVFLSHLGQRLRVTTHLLSSVKSSNDEHRMWAARRLEQLLGGVEARKIAVWGLTYKPGTDTLRRSSAVELCRWLADRGARVVAHDPAVKGLPAELGRQFRLMPTALDALVGAEALVVSTPWPEYREVSAGEVVSHMTGRLVIDANRFLGRSLGESPHLHYVSVGRAPRRLDD